MTYEFNQDLSTDKWTIMIDTTANYGYFEHNRSGTGGGLWFQKYENLVELVDYDGVPELAQSIVGALRGAGYYLDSTFDPEPPAPAEDERRRFPR